MNDPNIFQITWEKSRRSISSTVVLVCIAMFVVVAGLDLVRIVSRTTSVSVLGLSYVGIVQHLWLFRFITAPLMHGNLTHLLFNMLSLWMLGPDIEKALGRGRYVVFSILCAVASMIGFLLFNWGTGNIVIGYSGVIFGILVAQAVLFPDQTIAIFAFFPLKMKYAVILLGAVELYLTILPEKAGISNSAHLFGGVAAYLFLRGNAVLGKWRSKVRVRVPVPGRRTALRVKPRKDIPSEL